MEKYKISFGWFSIQEDGFTLKTMLVKRKILFSSIKDVLFVPANFPQSGSLTFTCDKTDIIYFDESQEDGARKLYDTIAKKSNCVIANVPEVIAKSLAPANFTPTVFIGNFMEIDESIKKIKFTSNTIMRNESYIDFEKITGYELIEDNESVIKSGLGRAVAGGVLFGGVGAIVGGSIAKRTTSTIIDSLSLVIK